MNIRVIWIDIAKFIGIFFVVLSHFELCPDYLRVFFSPFYLSIFFFCSGYTYKAGSDFKTFFRKKLYQLLTPWFIYSNLNILLSGVKSFKDHQNSVSTEIIHNLMQIRYYDERLWFIPALFTAYIPFYFVIRSYEKKKNTKEILILCMVLCLIRQVYKAYMNPDFFPWHLTSLPWHIDYIPTAMLFMILGYLFRHEWETFYDQKVDNKTLAIIATFYLVLVYYDFLNGYEFSMLMDFVYDHLRHIVSLMMVIGIAKRIPENRYMSFIGSNTLIYFCLHNKVVTLIEVIVRTILPGVYKTCEAAIPGTVFCFFATFVVSIILIIPTLFINRYLPWTVGKSLLEKKKTVETV